MATRARKVFRGPKPPSRLETRFETLWRAREGPELEKEFRFHPIGFQGDGFDLCFDAVVHLAALAGVSVSWFRGGTKRGGAEAAERIAELWSFSSTSLDVRCSMFDVLKS
jgi:hypothetical protein